MMYSTHSILALTPQNEDGKQILSQSLVFQKSMERRIFILHIVKSSSVFSKLFQPKKHKAHQKHIIHQFDQFVQDSIQKEIPKEIILRTKTGHLVETLIKESKKGGYEFIIVDKSGGQYNGALSPSEINRFISKSHCPVLTINKNNPIHKINTIVVPIDISHTTKKRMYWTTLFAKKFNAKVQIVSVLNINIDETKSLAFKNAEKIKSMLLNRGIESDVQILKAHDTTKHKILLDYIQKKHPELVIIRTHQEYQFSGKKIGKFVTQIIHGCKIPVFTVGGFPDNHPEDII